MITDKEKNEFINITRPLFETITANFGKVETVMKTQQEQLDKLKKFNLNRMVEVIDELQRDVARLQKKLDNKE